MNGTEQLEPWLLKEMDACISNIFLNEDQDTFIQLFNLILYENVNGMTIKADLCSYLLTILVGVCVFFQVTAGGV